MPDYTDDQVMIRDAVREFVQGEVLSRAREIDAAGEVPRETLRRMAELNLLGIPFPESAGGAGGDFVALTLALEEIARASGSLSLVVATHTAMVAWPIHKLAASTLREAWLPRLLSGEALGGVVLPEASPGGATPTVSGNGALAGMRLPALAGAAATLLAIPVGGDLALARAEGGAERRRVPSPLGMRASGWAECDLRGATEAVLVGGTTVLETAGRTAIAALATGLLQGTLDRVRPYVQERKQFGKPLASFDPIRAFVAGMAVDLDACRLLVLRVARAIDAGEDAGRAAIVAKSFCAGAAFRGARDGVQALGGYGYLTEYDVERHFRDAKFCEIGLGRTDDLLQGVGREELGG